jgi:hypothetical protein
MHSPRELIVEPIGLDPDKLPRPLNFPELFDNPNPVELEIGIGKGTFLTEQARAAPTSTSSASNGPAGSGATPPIGSADTTAPTPAPSALKRTSSSPSSSRRVDLGPAHLLPRPLAKVPPSQAPPDPAPFMKLVERILVPDGRLQVVTDHQGYFEENIDPAIRASNLTIVDYNRPRKRR